MRLDRVILSPASALLLIAGFAILSPGFETTGGLTAAKPRVPGPTHGPTQGPSLPYSPSVASGALMCRVRIGNGISIPSVLNRLCSRLMNSWRITNWSVN